jgi:hypothetical protein
VYQEGSKYGWRSRNYEEVRGDKPKCKLVKSIKLKKTQELKDSLKLIMEELD